MPGHGVKEILRRPYIHTHVHDYLLAAADDMAPCCPCGAGSVVVLFVCEYKCGRAAAALFSV